MPINRKHGLECHRRQDKEQIDLQMMTRITFCFLSMGFINQMYPKALLLFHTQTISTVFIFGRKKENVN